MFEMEKLTVTPLYAAYGDCITLKVTDGEMTFSFLHFLFCYRGIFDGRFHEAVGGV